MLWGFVMPVWLLIFFASLKAQLACLGCDLTKETQDKNQCHWAKYTHFLVFSFFLLRKHSPLYKYWNAFLWDVIISSDFVIFRHSAKMLSPYSFFLFSIWLLILFAGEHQVGSSSTIVGTKFESISENVPFLYRWHYGWGFRTLHVHRSYLLSHECRFFFFLNWIFEKSIFISRPARNGAVVLRGRFTTFVPRRKPSRSWSTRMKIRKR